MAGIYNKQVLLLFYFNRYIAQEALALFRRLILAPTVGIR